jgi:hypothetical protein
MANNILNYGFHNYSALAANRIAEMDAQVVFDMVNTSAAMHTERVNALLSGLTERITEFRRKFILSAPVDMQPVTSDSSSKPVKPLLSYNVDLPLRRWGSKFGLDYETAAKITLAELEALTMTMLMGDGKTMKRHMLASIFTNTDWSFADDDHGTLTIKGLANADGTLYPQAAGGTEDSQHYLAQAAAIADNANPYDNIYAQLKKHPSNNVGPSTPIVCYIPTNLVATTKALANFVDLAATDIRMGADNSEVVAAASLINQVKAFGDEVLGKCDGCWIVQWGALPPGYIFAHAQGAGPVLGMREQPEAALQGLHTLRDTSSPVLQSTEMRRIAGFAVMNRVAALVYRIGDASYAIPTGYTQPLAA